MRQLRSQVSRVEGGPDSRMCPAPCNFPQAGYPGPREASGFLGFHLNPFPKTPTTFPSQ